MPTWSIVLSILGGLFSLAGALFDWEFFMSNYRAAVFVRWLGRTGARILYAVLGLFLVGMGVSGALHIIP